MSECPRPDKIVYPDLHSAILSRKAIRAQGGPRLWAYRCRCGQIHLGKRRPPQQVPDWAVQDAYMEAEHATAQRYANRPRVLRHSA